MTEQRTREYVVFTKAPNGTYVMVGAVEASGASAAIRAMAEKAGSGAYAASPSRSWHESTVEFQTRIVVTQDGRTTVIEETAPTTTESEGESDAPSDPE